MANCAYLIGANSRGLQYAETDVGKVALALEGIGFQVKVGDRYSKASQVIEEFREFAEAVSRKDNLLFYFVGHGIAGNRTVKLALNSTDYNRNNTFLNSLDILSSFAELNCQSKLMILDCCESAHSANLDVSHIRDFELITVAESWEKSPEIEEFQAGAFAHFFCLALEKGIMQREMITSTFMVGSVKDCIAVYNLNSAVKIPEVITLSGKNIKAFQFSSKVSMRLHPEVTELLETVNTLCKGKNIYPYSIFVYLTLLKYPKSNLSKVFDQVQPDLSARIQLFLEHAAQSILGGEKMAKPFSPIDWENTDFFQSAWEFVTEKRLAEIDLGALLVGLLRCDSNTTIKIQQLLRDDFSILLKYAEDRSLNYTPYD